MLEYKINLNEPPVIIMDVVNFIELAHNPIRVVLILRSEFSLFLGDKNIAIEYIDGLMNAIPYSTEIIPDFLDKTIGGPDRVSGLIENFNKSFQVTIKESEYFGSLLLDPDSKSKLNEYIKDPFSEKAENDFLGSLESIVSESEGRLDKEYELLKLYMARIIT